MRKIIAIGVLVILTVSSQAQSEALKLVNNAFEQPVSSMGTYKIDNRKNKNATLSDVEYCIRNRNGLIISSSEKQHLRFGEKIKIVDKVEFISLQDFSRYAYMRLRKNTNVDFDQLKEKGIFFYPEGFASQKDASQVVMINFFNTVRRNVMQTGPKEYGESKTMTNVFWSGAIVDGCLEGQGVGLVKIGDSWGVFEGNFDAGFPVRDFSMTLLSSTMKQSSVVYKTFTRPMIIQVTSKVHKGAFKAYAKKHYNEDASKLEDLYKKTLSINNNSNSFDESLPYAIEFLSLYSSSDVDPKGILPKAKELADINQIRLAMLIHIDGDYTMASLLYGIKFDKYAASQDTTLINTAYRIAKKGSSNKQCDFNKFYSKVLPTLSNKKEQIYKSINRSIDIVKNNGENLLSSTVDIDVEALSFNDFKYTEEPGDHWKEYRKNYDEYSKEIRFEYKENGNIYYREGKIIRYKFKGEYRYMIEQNLFSAIVYDNYNDAVIGLFALERYGKVRKKGKV